MMIISIFLVKNYYFCRNFKLKNMETTLIKRNFTSERNKKSPYDPKFVEKIRKSETEPSETIELKDYGIKI